MDALNFLFQKPTANWFDFYLEPSKLVPHLEQKKPEPSSDQLIAQFCDQAKIEEQQATAADILPDDADYHRRKAKKLWCLALMVCSQLKWNVKTLRKKCHVVHKKLLMQALGGLVTGSGDLETILQGSVMADDCPFEMAASIQIFCARWILDTIRTETYPTPPPKITVSNPSAQVDPSLPMLEAKAMVLQEFKSKTDLAMDCLKRAINDGAYLLVTPACFVIPDEGNREIGTDVRCDWTKVEIMSPQMTILQCTYDMAEHYFFIRNFKAARECMRAVSMGFSQISSPMHEHFTLERSTLDGYCRALQIDAQKNGDQGIPDEQSTSNQQSSVSKFAEEEKNINEKSHARYAQVHSTNFLTSINDLHGVTERNIQFLRKPENAAIFCQVLKTHLSVKTSKKAKALVRFYIRFLCSCYPPLLDTLNGCLVLERLCPDENSSKDFTSIATRTNEPVLDLSLLSKLEPPWQVLYTFDTSELKNAAQRTQPNRVSSHFSVPVSVQPLLLKLPAGIYQDMVALATCKAQQLISIGATSAVTALLDLASHEARSGLGETAPELTWELIRLELVRWHNLLFRCSDVQKMSQMTTELANKVKQFVAAHAHKGAVTNVHWELYMLVTSFLLNTCDFLFIIMQCPSFHRFANFGKLLASLCYEVFTNSANAKNVAREFFDIMLPTMMDSVQYKRGAGGSQTAVYRDAPVQLLSRSNFLAIVKTLKEPTAVSLLLSFFVKIYNAMTGGLAEIFAEHLLLWPPTFVDSAGVNETFLKEVILVTLENGLLVDPNNAFWLRARGDYEFVNDHLDTALQYYLQCLLSCSDGFTKPLPENVVDDRLILNMVKCSGRMECHTLEAMFCQLLREPNYGLAIKALQEASSYDGTDAYYHMIWDPALLELLIYSLEKSNQQQARMDAAMRLYAQQDNNVHNDENIFNIVTAKRRKAFLTAVCRLFL